jgi:Zn-dependent M28 family amino/carboxypeptidase
MRRPRVLALFVLMLLSGPGVWTQSPGGSTAPAPIVVDRGALLADLAALSADAMEGREAGTTGGARARAYLVERFKRAGLAAFASGYLQPVRGAGRAGDGGDMANVIGHLRGTRHPGRYLVVSAHYDHIGVQNGTVFNGANDNASGTAALVAVARHFAEHPPAHSLIVAAFDAEERGLVGARAFVRTPPVPREAIVLNLNVDMIGRETEDRLFVVGTRLNPSLAPVIQRVARRAPLRLIMGHDDPADRGADWTRDSDQYAFIEAGIPGLLFSVEDTAEHHRATDDFETMTYDFYVRAVRTVIDVVEEFDRPLRD